MRKSYVQDPDTLELVEKDEYVPRRPAGITIWGDAPDFKSTIDGKVYSGRAGMREHCKLHNVVPFADLAGLPTSPPPVRPDREAIRQTIADITYGRLPVMRRE